MTVEIALNDSVDSLPPFRIAALADLIANEAMFAMTSGRASKMIKSTPMGQVWRCKVKPSSSSVRRSTLPTAKPVSRVGRRKERYERVKMVLKTYLDRLDS